MMISQPVTKGVSLLYFVLTNKIKGIQQILLPTYWQLSRLYFSASKMLDFLILNRCGWLLWTHSSKRGSSPLPFQTPWPSLPPPSFFKSLFPLPSFLFQPLLRYFRQFLPPSRVRLNDSWFVFHDSSWSFYEPYFRRKHVFLELHRMNRTHYGLTSCKQVPNYLKML